MPGPSKRRQQPVDKFHPYGGTASSPKNKKQGSSGPSEAGVGPIQPSTTYSHGQASIISAFPRIPKISRKRGVVQTRDDLAELSDFSDNSSDGLPQWYLDIDLSKPSTQTSIRRTTTIELRRIIILMNDFDDRYGNISPYDCDDFFNKIRSQLHCLTLMTVNSAELKQVRTLDRDRGLPRLFDSSEAKEKYPWDIVLDAQELYNKWADQQLDPYLLAGIQINYPEGDRSRTRVSMELDKSYPRTSARFFGDDGLVNGQWFPTQLCALRDGAHGALQGGIYGSSEGEGAYSVVMKDSHYEDRDDGDVVWYCGTDSAGNFKITADTQYLRDSVRTGNPVRLLRGSQKITKKGKKQSTPELDEQHKYRPEMGLRYDGLYDVVQERELDSAIGKWIFKLVRREGQHPIRWEGLEARPTQNELKEWKRIKEVDLRQNEYGYTE
ncbi:hypothetical protein K402DRAFT_394504 [Aulographum hederae CBS 113979]|uniref:YDG domain-containing protein n=1 Tax=Aulographum hederae CBS 113979 TaxID=1176131 RepID=A0A6G1GXI2_9PEZI|nr:hypothetical protein K402DRAFT_394504 [Aulographum hederae CBS 113979]